MKTLIRRLLLLVLILAGVRPAAAQTPAAASLRLAQPNAARFPEVTLYAYPVDARGVFMSGAGANAFQVTENGLPAQIRSLDARGGSLDVCLALDCSLSMVNDAKLEYARRAAREFLQQLGAEDQAGVVTFADGSMLEQPLTRDRDLALAAVDRSQATGMTTAFLDGVYWAITQVALRPQGGGSVVGSSSARSGARRVVLALTDGQDNASKVTMQQLIDYARANGVSLYMVALGEDAAIPPLQYLAQQTGGICLDAPAPQDLQRLYAGLAEQLRREYRITFRSPHPEGDGKRREIRVSLPAAALQGDTWYQAPGQGSLLVTAPAGGSASSDPATAAPGGKPPQVFLGALLMVAGLGAAVTGVLLWLGLRQRRLPFADSNPRIDLLPLWVRGGSTVVGRGAECELVLDSHQVSRIHARILAGNGVFTLFDEGSRNGTFVNGRRVRRSRELQVGDVIRFGDREFRFAGELPA